MARPRGFNTWTIKYNIAYAILKHGTVVVSKSDYLKVREYRWFTKKSKSGKYYVYSHYRGNKKILIHRFLLNVDDPKIFVDHIDGNTLNNTTDNIRIATRSENSRNAKKNKRGLSRYKGVTKRPGGRFGAYIQKNGKPKCLGTFDTEEDAAKAYDKEATILFKQFANLNFKQREK